MNRHWRLQVYEAGVAVPRCKQEGVFSSGLPSPLSGCCLVELSQNTVLDLRIENLSNAANVIVTDANLGVM